ncbi:MAG TPA: hypothetical protein VIR57_07490 [Chloroflexota bacterium]
MICDPGLRFWLRYAERRGALVEPREEGALVVLPEPLQRRLSMPEEIVLTADPEVAEEEDAVLLMPGHPALEQAAAEVLDEQDVAYGFLPWPPIPAPSSSALLEQARSDLTVDHGRIDPDGVPAAVRLPVLRMGALVTYTLEQPFQEREEVWVDAHQALVLDSAAKQVIEQAAPLAAPDIGQWCLEPDLECALGVAHEVLSERVATRMAQLSRRARAWLEDERRRVEAYYAAILESIAERRARAAPERTSLYDAQADAAQVERARRLRELEEKHQGRSDIRPFRLHVVLVPAYRLPIVVRRGSRTYPFALVWLPATRRFLPQRCPACGAASPLVAGRQSLGCRACLAAAVEQVPPASPRAAKPKPEPGISATPGQERPAAAATSKPVPSPARRNEPVLKAAGQREEDEPLDLDAAMARYQRETRQMLRAADHVAFDFWQRVTDRKPWRRVARDSSLAALYQLYGPLGPLYAVGAPRGSQPSGLTSWTGNPSLGGKAITWGVINIGTEQCAFGLLWQLVEQHPVISEVLPAVEDQDVAVLYPDRAAPELASRLTHPPLPGRKLDRVAEELWAVDVPLVGLPIVVRCLARWWQPGVQATLADERPEATAAALIWHVTRDLRSRPPRQDVAGAHRVSLAELDRALRQFARG